jgi:toxin ParE1/3/4
MNVIVLDQAKREVNQHIAWYRGRDIRSAQRLAVLFEKALADIAASPHSFSLMEMRRNPGNVRRVRLKNFPIYIPYQVLDSEIYVVAVAHAARRPGYWRRRLPKR